MTDRNPIDPARERYEHPEMERAEVGRPAAWTLIVAFALIVVVVPAWRLARPSADLLGVLAGGVDQARLELGEQGAVAANRALLASMNAFEDRLEESSPLLDAALPTTQWLELRFGGKGNEQVYPGAGSDGGGWLIFRPGFDHLVGHPFLDPGVLERRRRAGDSWRPPVRPEPRTSILALRDRLAERGVDLVLLPVPTKPAVQASSLAPGAPRPLTNPSTDAFFTEMNDEGIHVVDVAAILGELIDSGADAYLRTDSHWSPAAAQAVAEHLASWLKTTYGDKLGPNDGFFQATSRERTGRGDLWRLLKLPESRPLYGEEAVTVREITSWDGGLWSPSDAAPVLVLGDSFVNVYSDEGLHWGRAAGFAEQLAFGLERHVDRMARNDGATDQVLRELARSTERLDGTRVVVFQFAMRELSVGDWWLP